MKGNVLYKLSLLLVAGLLLAAGVAVAASAKDAGKLNADIALLNSYKSLPQGDKMITKQLTDSFSVSKDKISSLLQKNMKYGDIAATLAFADKMDGGVTDANISRVVDMKSKGGWDQVAKNLNLDIGDVSSKLSSVEDDAHDGIKQALADSFSSGRAAGGTTDDSGMGAGGSEDMGGSTGGTTGGGGY